MSSNKPRKNSPQQKSKPAANIKSANIKSAAVKTAGGKTPSSKKSAANMLIIGLGITAFAAIILFYYCKSFNFVQDDSFITYRYVKNFADGNGLVFNLGEKVEGYTCFLWVILLAAFKKLGFDIVPASQTLGIISSLLTLLFTYLISIRIFPKGKDTFYNLAFSLVAVIMVAANGSNAYWAASGMETGLFSFLVTAGIFMYLKEYKSSFASFPFSSIVFLLAALTRPEGNLIFAITVIHKIIVTLKSPVTEGQSKAKLLLSKNNIIWLAMYLVPAIIFMSWRYSYYGYLFPNTFYAKTGSSWVYFQAGLDYFWEFAKSYGAHGVLITLTLVTLRNKERFYEYLYLIMIFFIFSIYVIYIGGDVLRPNRFFVPILPVFFILVQEGLSELITAFEKKKSFALGGIIGLAFALGFSYYTYKEEVEQIKQYSVLENALVKKMQFAGQWLKNKQTQSGKPLVIAASTIGAISYYSEVTLIDMLGLTDKEIAHNPTPIPEISSKETGWRERNYNVDYVLSRKPDYIFFSTGVKPSAFAERGLFTSEEFLKYYYSYFFPAGGNTFSLFKRKTDEEARSSIVSTANPNYKKSYVNLYNQAMNTQKDDAKFNEALELYNRVIAEGPKDWGTPYQWMGDIYMQQKDLDKAFQNYRKAIELDDYLVMAHYGLYQLFLGNKDTANAKISIDKIRKYSPELVQ